MPPAITSQPTVATPKLPHTVTSVPASSTISDKIKKPLPKTTKQAEPETDKVKKPSEINRKITQREYDRVVNYAIQKGFANAFVQDLSAADEKFVPEFNLQGV